METKISETTVLTPLEVAKDLLRGAMLKKGYIDLQVSGDISQSTLDGSAHIKAKTRQVVVTAIYGVEIWEEIPIYEVMKEILKEAIEKLSPNSDVIYSRKKSQSAF